MRAQLKQLQRYVPDITMADLSRLAIVIALHVHVLVHEEHMHLIRHSAQVYVGDLPGLIWMFCLSCIFVFRRYIGEYNYSLDKTKVVLKSPKYTLLC